MQRQPKIPTIIGIILVIALMVGIGYLFEFLSRGQTRASSSIEPQKVTITNVSDTGFTFVWETEEPASGNMIITSGNGKKYSAFDERDATGTLGKYVTHSVSVRSLQPTTTYDVTILSNGKRYPTDQKNYQVTTYAALSSNPSNIDPAYGKVITDAGTPAEGAILFLTLTDSQTLSTIVRNSGSWIIPLSTIRTSDGTSYLPISERIMESLLIQKAGVESKVITDTLNDSPVPDITIGQQYDFRNRDAKKTTQSNIAKAPTPSVKSNTAVLGVQTTKNTSGSIALTSPKQGAAVSTTRPQITGLGIVGKKVTITFNSNKPIVVGTTTVDGNGMWKYTPTISLAPGKQNVTITTTDAKNKPVVISHTFTILKSGTQVLGDATPSGTLTETPTPTLESTNSGTPSPTTESTIAAEPMPTSGSYLPTIILLLLGTAFLIGGGSLLLTR